MRNLLKPKVLQIIDIALQRLAEDDQFVPPEIHKLIDPKAEGHASLADYAAAVESLIEASKELVQNLEDASETKQDDGTDYADIAAVRAALLKFGVDA